MEDGRGESEQKKPCCASNMHVIGKVWIGVVAELTA